MKSARKGESYILQMKILHSPFPFQGGHKGEHLSACAIQMKISPYAGEATVGTIVLARLCYNGIPIQNISKKGQSQ